MQDGDERSLGVGLWGETDKWTGGRDGQDGDGEGEAGGREVEEKGLIKKV